MTGAKIVEELTRFFRRCRHFLALRAGRDHQRRDDSKAQGSDLVAGGLSNQLLRERHGDELQRRGIPVTLGLRRQRGRRDQRLWRGRRLGRTARALDKADDIYDTVLKVFDIAESQTFPLMKRRIVWPNSGWQRRRERAIPIASGSRRRRDERNRHPEAPRRWATSLTT